jgi:hypothetical protein
MGRELAAKWPAQRRKLLVVPIAVNSIDGEDKIAGKHLADLVIATLKQKGFEADFQQDAAGVIAEARQDGGKKGKAAKKPLVALVYGHVTVTGDAMKPRYQWRLSGVVPDTTEILVEVLGESAGEPPEASRKASDAGR